MKKTILIFAALAFFTFKNQAQNYTISFAATGIVTTLDSIKVENLTQATSLTVPGADTLYLTLTTGINNLCANDESIVIYPNPMQGQAELMFFAKEAGNVHLKIFDISGKEIFLTSDYFWQGIQKFRIAGLKQGIYFVSVRGENYSYTSKLISLNTEQSDPKIEFFGNEKPENILKSTEAMINMAYTTGDNLRFTGYSGVYSEIVTDVPTASKTITFVFAATNVAIGDSYKGGIVAYILQPGDPGYNASVQHGIIAAPTDQSAGIQWHNGVGVTTGATATALGTGNANTNTIVSVQGLGSYAAQLCADLDMNGYSDWYLPSKDELNKLFLSSTIVGGYVSLLYWASTETNASDACIQSFSSGNQLSYGKNYLTAVRAIRAF